MCRKTQKCREEIDREEIDREEIDLVHQIEIGVRVRDIVGRMQQRRDLVEPNEELGLVFLRIQRTERSPERPFNVFFPYFRIPATFHG